ncbi:MAG TPA: adenylate/guanylate cyclase domain-containing protein [Burkholderiaceae bacterium]|nr:adenylate/guanylate cyclase domain-containing protein [Burkholderiaceae bacterium]
MTRITERTVLFADLRGSTSLYEQLGNAEATSVVTHTVGAIARAVPNSGGQVIKTLGDGLMAVFDKPTAGLTASDQMHEVLDVLVSRGSERGASPGLRALKLQIALARGEVVEMGGDCYGDAVNVAARLLDHAGDNETLVTSEVFKGLPREQQARFRRLDRMQLRGRVEPVQVHLLSGDDGRRSDQAATQFGEVDQGYEPEGIRLVWAARERVYAGPQLPIVLGRSPQVNYCIDDTRVSRLHARIDWHGGAFQLTDLSYNGTYVKFGNGEEVVSLRRSSCTLHGQGLIGLGGPPGEHFLPTIDFEILIFMDTVPPSP